MTRSRGLLWLVAGLFIALLAGLIAFQALNRAQRSNSQQAAEGPLVKAVAAARNVPVRTLLTAADVSEIDVPAATLPPGAVTRLEDAIGKLTTTDLFQGEVILADRLLDPNVIAPDGRLALVLVDNEVLMAIPAQDILSRAKVLQPGDHVDILFSLDFPVDRTGGSTQADEEQSTFTLLQNIPVVGLVGPNQARPQQGVTEQVTAESQTGVPDAVLITLTPQDALTLKYAIDAGGTMDMVLRAPGVDRPFETDPVDPDYIIGRYGIPYEQNR